MDEYDRQLSKLNVDVGKLRFKTGRLQCQIATNKRETMKSMFLLNVLQLIAIVSAGAAIIWVALGAQPASGQTPVWFGASPVFAVPFDAPLPTSGSTIFMPTAPVIWVPRTTLQGFQHQGTTIAPRATRFGTALRGPRVYQWYTPITTQQNIMDLPGIDVR